ncbi:MAG: MtrB/PioB family outer membrane beta-barrel protein, partial [Candidatus Rokubacteria bacterium]|nr:MtrB/PioB family outer membrane beta-barrel protein [Candidatus Rokubacteria bacterium]
MADGARLLHVDPDAGWDLKAEFTRIHKDGQRPMGMAFGSPGGNFREILEPINQTIYDVRLSASLAREKYQLQFAYNLSLFKNDFDSVISDNPCFGLAACGSSATGPARGRTALAPDNVAQTVTLSGGVSLPLRTRVNGSLSYSWRLQDQNFIPHTINPAFTGNPDLALPQSDLKGDVRILLFNVSATSRPLPPLTLTGRYRLYDFDDRSDEIVFPARVLNDITLENEPRLANRFPYTKHNASLDGRWRFSSQLAS